MMDATKREAQIDKAAKIVASPRAEMADEDYDRRLKVAGMGRDDPVPEDIDVLRSGTARRVAMYLNRWHGCPEYFCRRERGCMAPNISCSNRQQQPPMSDQDRQRIAAQFRRVLRKLGEQDSTQSE